MTDTTGKITLTYKSLKEIFRRWNQDYKDTPNKFDSDDDMSAEDKAECQRSTFLGYMLSLEDA